MLLVIRIILMFFILSAGFIVGIVVGILRPFNPKNVKLVARIVSFAGKACGIEFELRNKERLDQYRPCVFICNHQNNYDLFPGSHAVPDRTVTLGKKSLLYIPLFGAFYWLSGNILINRQNKKSAFATMDVAAKAIHEKNISIWIFPEGTRSRGRGLLPFKKGAFITAIKAQVPVIPIVVSHYAKDLNFNKWKAGLIIIEVLPPIHTTGLSLDDVGKIKDEAQSLYTTTLKNLDAEAAVRLQGRS